MEVFYHRSLITRKQLAEFLQYSERTIADDPEFQQIEIRVFGRGIRYNIDDVYKVLGCSKSKRIE